MIDGPWASCLALALLLALPSRPARAALGEAEASIAGDRTALGAQERAAIEGGGFAVHELIAGGTIIREYVAPDGVVFAVAWNGLATPALQPLLGSYADEVQRAARPARGRRALRVTTARVVLERWGHMRDQHGRAYLPALVPEGVSLDAIR